MLESAVTALLRALISVEIPVLRAASAAPNDAAAVLVAWDREETADTRPLTSELNTVLNDESASERDAVAEPRVLESAVTALLRVPVSATREANNTAFPLITVDANEGSVSIAVVSSSSVLSVELMSPAIAATLVLTYASVAMAVALYLGWFVKSHWPAVVVLPENVMLPDTSSWPAIVAVCTVALPACTVVAFAVEMVAVVMLAVGKVAVPVRTALCFGALSRCNASSAMFRAVISWFSTAVRSDKWEMTSEFTPLPMTTLVINVQL